MHLKDRVRTQITHPCLKNNVLGDIPLMGSIRNSSGDGQGNGRRLGHFALVYSLYGKADYHDEINGKLKITPGDMLLLFPDVAHKYGASRGNEWDEFFIVFGGPIFDLWKEKKILDPRNHLFHLEPVSYWFSRMKNLFKDSTNTFSQMSRLQEFLGDILSHNSNTSKKEPNWLTESKVILSQKLEQPLNIRWIAQKLRMSPETFRKQFERHSGMPPIRYRNSLRINQACSLLRETSNRCSDIAEVLGYSDIYHFSKNFKQATKYTPLQFRKRFQESTTQTSK